MKPIAHAPLLVLSLCASAITLPAAHVASSAQEVRSSGWTVFQPPPDPCVSTQLQINPEPWPSQNLTVLGASARLFEAGPSSNPGDPPRRHNPSLRPLVLIVDGNGFSLSDYDDLAAYLAAKGFNVVVIDRPNSNGPDPVDFALAGIHAAFKNLELPANAPVGVIGHSVGGAVAIDTIVENLGNAAGYNIGAVVLLAPKVGDGTGVLLNAGDVPALLTVYGSQDNDVGGLGTALTDAFAAYDRSGNESSTTCHQAFCEFEPQMHRTMVYVHGADHSGLINQDPGLPGPGSDWDSFNNYLSRSNQFCIAKAYTLAMLEWTLDANPQWKSMVHGKHVPASIQAMTTAAADELGNAAGSPLRMALQVSPNKRSVIENFEDGSWEISTQTPDVLMQLVTEGEFAGGDMNIRHATKLGLVAWPEQDDWQLVGFEVPVARRDVTGFTHLAVRLGQLAGVSDATLANPVNTDTSIMIGLYDGNSSSWEWSHVHGKILPADERPNGQHQSVMGTIKIPLSSFGGINKGAIEEVLLAFPDGTRGTLLIDSLEWFKE
jgi:pimeloyl-ACP methyl ester carboxylesterase